MKALDLMPCTSPWWANNGHLQTILGRYIPGPSLKHSTEMIQMTLPDGDILTGNFIRGNKDNVAYLFHGLGGSATSAYMQRSANILANLGFNVYMMNHRGAGIGAGLARSTYHSGRYDDISFVLEHGRNRFPSAHHLLIGFSLSGAASLNLLGTEDKVCLPDAAITFNAPLDLRSTSISLQQGFNRLYDFKFVRDANRDIKHRQKLNLISLTYRPRLSSTLYEVDDNYVAPLSKFESAEHYYKLCSPLQRLSAIKVPVIAFTAQDDPFIEAKDYFEARPSSMVQIHIESEGGHMGFLSARTTPRGDFRWLDYALEEAALKLAA